MPTKIQIKTYLNTMNNIEKEIHTNFIDQFENYKNFKIYRP
jgi:hypothetical protein